MKWVWAVLLYVLQNVCSLDLETNSPPTISNKNLNKGRQKTARITNYLADSAVNPGSLDEIIEPYFPDVVYPKSILEAGQPFYYSHQGHDDVLGPFPNDIKSSYKTLVSKKGKNPSTDYSSSPTKDHKNAISLNESSILNNTLNSTNVESYDNSSRPGEDLDIIEQNEEYSVIDKTITNNNTLHTVSQYHTSPEIFQHVAENTYSMNKDILNNTGNDFQLQNMKENITIPIIIEQISIVETEENFPETIDARNSNETFQDRITSDYFASSDYNNSEEDVESVHTKDSNKTYYINGTPHYLLSLDTVNNTQYVIERLDTINDDNISYVDLDPNSHVISNNDRKDKEKLETRNSDETFNVNTTPNYTLTLDEKTNEIYTEISEITNSNITYYENVNPNYIITSETGNTREDFVSDIMNIYSLIEETLRAVTVVEFVVSKTLDTLGLKENQNETIAYEYDCEAQFKNK